MPLIPAKAGTQAFSTTKDTKFTKVFVSFVNFVVPLQLGADLSWAPALAATRSASQRGDERIRIESPAP